MRRAVFLVVFFFDLAMEGVTAGQQLRYRYNYPLLPRVFLNKLGLAAAPAQELDAPGLQQSK